VGSYRDNEIDICFASAFSVLKEIEFTRCLQNYNDMISILFFFLLSFFFSRSSLLPKSTEFTSSVGVIWEQLQTGRYCWVYNEDLKVQCLLS